MADDTYSRGYRNDPQGRDGAGASGPSTDPLTELARLIGQSDPFAAGANRDRRPDPRDPQSSQDWPGSESPNPQYPDQHRDRHEPSFEGRGSEESYADRGYPDAGGYDDQHAQSDHGYQDGAYARPAAPGYDAPLRSHSDTEAQGHEMPYFGANEHGPGQDDDFYEDEPAPRRRGGLITVAALVGLAVIGTAGAFAYRTVFTGPSGAPPLIRADGGPNKIVPLAQNTDNAANKQIYDRMGDRGQNERVIPREEQPINIPDPARSGTPRMGAAAGSFATLPGGPPAQQAFPDTSAVAPPQSAQATPGEPRKIRTVTIKADQPANEPARAAPPPMRGAPAASPPANQSAAAPRASASAPASNAPLSLAPQDVASAAAPPPAAAPARAAPPPRVAHAAPPPRAAVTTGGESGYFVQVTAQKSEDEARASFRGIQARYASVLNGRDPVIRRKDLGTRGIFYGAQVGPYSREDAVQLCESLKSAGASCMVQRN